MYTLSLTESEKRQIEQDLYIYPSKLVQKRLHVLHLKNETDLSHQKIAKIVNVSSDSVTNYIKLYQAKGLSGIYEIGYGTNKSELDKHTDKLLSHFKKEPPHDINQAIAEIKRLTDIERKPTQVRKWLKKHGLKYRKTGQIPSKAKKKTKSIF